MSQSTLTPPPATSTGRVSRVIAIGALLLLGVGAIAGGMALVTAPDGSAMGFEPELLAGSPFSDYLMPGLILGGLFGIGSFVTAWLGWRRHPVAPFLAFAIGCGQMVWIVVQLGIIGTENLSFLHPAMFLVGMVSAAAAVPWGRPTFQAWRAGSDAARRDQLPS